VKGDGDEGVAGAVGVEEEKGVEGVGRDGGFKGD